MFRKKIIKGFCMMNRIKVCMGVTAVLLTFGIIFVSCGEPSATDVILNNNKSPQVSSVTAVKTTDNKFFIVSWNAIGGDVKYEVWYMQEGKKTYTQMTSVYAQNTLQYETTGGLALPNDDPDKWSVKVSSANFRPLAAGTYSFGIRTNLNDSTVSTTYSDIKWADSFEVEASPAVTDVTASRTSSNYYAIASWKGISVDGYNINKYDVVLYHKDSNGILKKESTSTPTNAYFYSLIDGSPESSSDPYKWSCRASDISDLSDFYFTITPVIDDIDIFPSVAVSNTVK